MQLIASVVRGWNVVEAKILARVYYGRLEMVTVEDALNNGRSINVTKGCGYILRELMRKGHFENFKCLLSLLGNDVQGYFDFPAAERCGEWPDGLSRVHGNVE